MSHFLFVFNSSFQIFLVKHIIVLPGSRNIFLHKTHQKRGVNHLEKSLYTSVIEITKTSENHRNYKEITEITKITYQFFRVIYCQKAWKWEKGYIFSQIFLWNTKLSATQTEISKLHDRFFCRPHPMFPVAKHRENTCLACAARWVDELNDDLYVGNIDPKSPW